MSFPRTIPRMRLTAVMVVVIFFASVLMKSAAKVTIDNPDFETLKNYSIITRKNPLELNCTVDGEGFTFTWTREHDGIVEEIKEGITKKKVEGKETSTLKILKPGDENAGVYECSVRVSNSNETLPENKANITVVSYPSGSMDSDVIVIEGEKLTMDCQPSGSPDPEVTWIIGDNNVTVSTDRIKLLPNKHNVSNAILEIRDVKMSDRGEYKCKLSNIATTLKNEEAVLTAKVRVKDKLAALWPFLGICAEVFVLCAIIFIYEKKRNKAELDESDTDNSPEQKNTPDHGKDSVRQRK